VLFLGKQHGAIVQNGTVSETRLFDTPCSIAEHSPFFSPFSSALVLLSAASFKEERVLTIMMMMIKTNNK